MNLILAVLVTVSPVILGGILHMAVVQQGYLAALAKPLDGGRCWRGRRLLGDHKTWRGLLLIVLGTALLTSLQAVLEHLFPQLRSWNLVDLERLGAFSTGLLWGLGYALAELPNSFLKRQLGIKEGKGSGGFGGLLQTLIDQGDSALGCALIGWIALQLNASEAWLLAGVCTALHLLLNFLMGSVGLRQRRL